MIGGGACSHRALPACEKAAGCRSATRPTVFILAYYSFRDPVFQSAVLPYFLNFPHRRGYEFVLLTFERAEYGTGPQERGRIREFLAGHEIRWFNVNWHSGRFKPIKKLYDFVAGVGVAHIPENPGRQPVGRFPSPTWPILRQRICAKLGVLARFGP